MEPYKRSFVTSPGSPVSSPGASTFSPSESEISTTNSSVSSCVSSSRSPASSMHQASTVPVVQPAQEFSYHRKRPDRASVVICCNYGPQDLKNYTCKKHLNHRKGVMMGSRSYKDRSIVVTMRKKIFRLAGAFAADCTAVCCCPCAVIPLLAWVLVEAPSAVATKIINHMRKIPSLRNSVSRQQSSGDDTYSIITLPSSNMEPCKEGDVQADNIVPFGSENLLKHFDAEFVGFGCLSLKRE